MTDRADRAGVLVIHDGRVALIERRPGTEHDFVAPGGGIDRGETAEAAAMREAHEERVWMPIDRVQAIDLRPTGLAEMIVGHRPT